MLEAGEEIEIYPIKVLFDMLETSEVRLSRKPKMDLSHLKPQDESGKETDAAKAEVIDGYKELAEEPTPV